MSNYGFSMKKNNKKHLAVLVPAFRSEYLEDLFFGLQNQSLKNFDVFISDDSKDNFITKNFKKSQLISKLNVTFFEGPKNARLNHMFLDQIISEKYDFIHFHLDDDYIYPTFYEEHMNAHKKGDFCASITQRWFANINNKPIRKPLDIFSDDNKYDSLFYVLNQKDVAKSTLTNAFNWLGELSNMVFKTENKNLFLYPPENNKKLNYYGLPDLGPLLNLLENKNTIFIKKALGHFRKHPSQSTFEIGTYGSRVSRLSWFAFAVKAFNEGILTQKEFIRSLEKQKLMLSRINNNDEIINSAYNILCLNDTLAKISDNFSELWVKFLHEQSPDFNKLEEIKILNGVQSR